MHFMLTTATADAESLGGNSRYYHQRSGNAVPRPHMDPGQPCQLDPQVKKVDGN